MRCERCNFENIPGQKTCVRCGSALEIKPTAGNIYPPRMSSWKRPLRNISRFIRSSKIVPEWNIKIVIPDSIKKHLNNNIWWLILSIIPGLGHSAQGRFKEIRWYFLAWLILVLAGLFSYGSQAAFILLGLAIGIHTVIALQSGIIKDFGDLKDKIIMGIGVLIVLVLIYWYAPQAVFHNIVGGYSGLTIPYHNVEFGDYLFGRRNFDHTAPLQRGTLILIHPALIRSFHYPYNIPRGVERSRKGVFAEIVGVAGEQLQVVDDTFIINEKKLDVEKYPVPSWLRNRAISVIIPDNNYFVSVPYNVQVHGVELNSSVILGMCLVKHSDIEAKAFLRWWPLSRRGFIKVD